MKMISSRERMNTNQLFVNQIMINHQYNTHNNIWFNNINLKNNKYYLESPNQNKIITIYNINLNKNFKISTNKINIQNNKNKMIGVINKNIMNY